MRPWLSLVLAFSASGAALTLEGCGGLQQPLAEEPRESGAAAREFPPERDEPVTGCRLKPGTLWGGDIACGDVALASSTSPEQVDARDPALWDRGPATGSSEAANAPSSLGEPSGDEEFQEKAFDENEFQQSETLHFELKSAHATWSCSDEKSTFRILRCTSADVTLVASLQLVVRAVMPVFSEIDLRITVGKGDFIGTPQLGNNALSTALRAARAGDTAPRVADPHGATLGRLWSRVEPEQAPPVRTPKARSEPDQVIPSTSASPLQQEALVILAVAAAEIHWHRDAADRLRRASDN